MQKRNTTILSFFAGTALTTLFLMGYIMFWIATK